MLRADRKGMFSDELGAGPLESWADGALETGVCEGLVGGSPAVTRAGELQLRCRESRHGGMM